MPRGRPRKALSSDPIERAAQVSRRRYESSGKRQRTASAADADWRKLVAGSAVAGGSGSAAAGRGFVRSHATPFLLRCVRQGQRRWGCGVVQCKLDSGLGRGLQKLRRNVADHEVGTRKSSKLAAATFKMLDQAALPV